MMSNKKQDLFKKRTMRVRNRIKKFSKDKVRMSVHRSSKNIYVQLIDDSVGKTITAASTRETALGKDLRNDIKTAALIGKEIAMRAKKSGIKEVYFDRGGFLFHGRVKALAEAAREAGLKF
tara:strand:+ start:228 stop:590 length:363 start_codon:yes stop_codon:yes gene_type:complete